MDADTKAKLDGSTYPREAIWKLGTGGNDPTGTIIARGPDYIEVRTEQGGTYRQADADIMALSFL